MKILLFLTLFCLVGLNQAIKKDIPKMLCNLVVNGTKIKAPEAACKAKYYECIDGIAIERECGKGYKFNKDREMCVPDKDCQNYSACNGLTKGYAPDPFSCDGYFTCGKSKLGAATETQGYCKDDMSFYDNLCWKSDKCNVDYCLMVPSYKYFGVDGADCSVWQMCKGDELVSGKCPNGTVFDRDDGTCDESLSGNCRPSTNPDNTKEGSYCDYIDFKADSKSCTGYLTCHKNKVVRSECAQGKFFDGLNQICDNRLNYLCDRGDPCEGLSKSTYHAWKWVNDPKDCRKYYHCAGDKSSKESTFCPESSPYFNEERQMCTKQKPTYKACHVEA
ncbi:hypothetical protein ACFFRR_010363 [Megaselia abdita]